MIDGRRVAYVQSGTGTPTIVLLSGAGMDIDSWFKVLPEVATLGTALAWDRPGVGRSDRAVVPQTGEVVVATLREVLAGAGLGPPYVLVAHSLGGLHAELLSRRHPEEVCGLVLIEAASPEEALDPPRTSPIKGAIGRVMGIVDRVRGDRPGLDEVDQVRETVRQIEQAPAFPNIPLVVVTGGTRMRLVPEAAFRAHLEAQGRRVGLSRRGRQVIAKRSGHFPQLTEPDVVVAAIRKVAGECAPNGSVT